MQTVSLNQLHALSHVNENVIYPFSSERLAYEQAHDRVLSEVKTWLQSDGPDYTNHFDVELLYYVELFSQLFIKDDIIFINFQEQNEDTYNLIFGSTCKILCS